MQTKTKQAIHLTKKDHLVLTNETSGKQTAYRVQGVEIDEEYLHPVRVHVHTPEAFDKKATTVVPFGWRDNVDILVEEP